MLLTSVFSFDTKIWFSKTIKADITVNLNSSLLAMHYTDRDLSEACIVVTWSRSNWPPLNRPPLLAPLQEYPPADSSATGCRTLAYSKERCGHPRSPTLHGSFYYNVYTADTPRCTLSPLKKLLSLPHRLYSPSLTWTFVVTLKTLKNIKINYTFS